jgi:hypothetical protein
MRIAPMCIEVCYDESEDPRGKVSCYTVRLGRRNRPQSLCRGYVLVRANPSCTLVPVILRDRSDSSQEVLEIVLKYRLCL